MKKIVQRLLVFFIGLPLVILLVAFLPQGNHLAANLCVVLFSSLGALELAGLLRRKNLSLPNAEALILGALAPLGTLLELNLGYENGSLLQGFLILGASWLLVSWVLAGEKRFDAAAGRIASGFSVMIYPGLFMSWVVRMSHWPRAGLVMLVFILIICVNDSAAWVAGNLFGKGNRGIVPVSPNKSLAGFIGGALASLLAGGAAVWFLPGVFSSPRLPSLGAGLILGFLSGLAGSLGDLGESLLKRSVQMKDSGSLIPGRGGALDTIDSIALAAPVYYGVYLLLFLG
jgi:phosphatidate cytidylyltransferase